MLYYDCIGEHTHWTHVHCGAMIKRSSLLPSLSKHYLSDLNKLFSIQFNIYIYIYILYICTPHIYMHTVHIYTYGMGPSGCEPQCHAIMPLLYTKVKLII